MVTLFLKRGNFMNLAIGMISFDQLDEEKKACLLGIPHGDPTKGIPVYLKKGEQLFFIEDYILNNNKEFEKNAVEDLFRGGGLLDLLTDKGRACIYDERYGLRQAAGIARFSEGKDLIKTAIREGILEEISIFYRNGDEKIKIVPKGYANTSSKQINNWNLTCDTLEEKGEIRVLDYFLNNSNKALEAIVQWDLSENDKNLIICHTEDWYMHGNSGFTVFAVDEKGIIVGCYDGQHGYMSFSNIKIHPTLTHVLSLNR